MLALEQQLVISINLLLATLLSAVIGLDREQSHHPAGLRTHMLIGLGSALFTTLSLFAFPSDDNSRIASNIVVGVGFLGAGAIIRSGERQVVGMTTAAGIWVVAAIGMACGSGNYLLAIVTTFFAWLILSVLGRIKDSATAKEAKNGTS
ncbi:MAG: MgtC/SapB family protein [Anaerolineae bacterium]|nr:MgtC/SapB family protein [Anaerolineae bacterium]